MIMFTVLNFILNFCSIDENFDRRYPVPAVIEHTGRVTWDPTGSFKSRCDVDVTWFPYDTQQCELHFYTWSYMETGVNLTIIPEGEFLEEYDDDGAWIIESRLHEIETLLIMHEILLTNHVFFNH